jgi:hypothetical protein
VKSNALWKVWACRFCKITNLLGRVRFCVTLRVFNGSSYAVTHRGLYVSSPDCSGQNITFKICFHLCSKFRGTGKCCHPGNNSCLAKWSLINRRQLLIAYAKAYLLEAWQGDCTFYFLIMSLCLSLCLSSKSLHPSFHPSNWPTGPTTSESVTSTQVKNSCCSSREIKNSHASSRK